MRIPTCSYLRSPRAETVELAPEAPPEVATVQETVIGFGQYLKANPAIVTRCSTKPLFAQEFKSWKSREATNGRKWRGDYGSILYKLRLFSATKAAQHGVVRVKNVLGQQIYYGASGMAAVAETLAEERERIEADKHGIKVTPLTLFDSNTIVRRGAVVERTLTVTNGSDEMRELISGRMMGRGGSEFSVSFTGDDGALVLMPNQVEPSASPAVPYGWG